MREFSGKDITISQSTKTVMATIDWTAALTLLFAVTVDGLPPIYAVWAVICALWGATFIGWALLVRERLRLERLADIMADELASQQGADIRALH